MDTTQNQKTKTWHYRAAVMVVVRQVPSCFLLTGGDFNIALDNVIDRWPSRPNTNLSAYLKLFMQI